MVSVFAVSIFSFLMGALPPDFDAIFRELKAAKTASETMAILDKHFGNDKISLSKFILGEPYGSKLNAQSPRADFKSKLNLIFSKTNSYLKNSLGKVPAPDSFSNPSNSIKIPKPDDLPQYSAKEIVAIAFAARANALAPLVFNFVKTASGKVAVSTSSNPDWIVSPLDFKNSLKAKNIERELPPGVWIAVPDSDSQTTRSYYFLPFDKKMPSIDGLGSLEIYSSVYPQARLLKLVAEDDIRALTKGDSDSVYSVEEFTRAVDRLSQEKNSLISADQRKSLRRTNGVVDGQPIRILELEGESPLNSERIVIHLSSGPTGEYLSVPPDFTIPKIAMREGDIELYERTPEDHLRPLAIISNDRPLPYTKSTYSVRELLDFTSANPEFVTKFGRCDLFLRNLGGLK